MRYHDSEATLPAVAAAVNEGDNADTLLLTLVFHPDVSRIGQCAALPLAECSAPRELGRSSPEFSGASAPTAPIGDPHVSRRALQFDVSGRHLRLRRYEGASRCRVGNEDLFAETLIESAQLAQGVPIMLSHSVVLWMRSVRLSRIPAEYADSAAGLLGVSCSMQALRAEIARVAQTDVDVLIRGETGSGKELVARALHTASARKSAPLVSVNIAAIPAELAAVALFGSTRGAFTGAERATPGYFRQAQGGSLFLDEIGDTASTVQPQLLRALQQREIQPLGGSVERVDLRVISATDVSLDEPGSDFRAALRHRLGACEITVPPLRDHPEDIGVLLLHFLRLAAQESDLALPLIGADLQPQMIAAWAGVFFHLLGYAWPGNVRELANVARRIALAGDGVPRLDGQLSGLPSDRAYGAAAKRPAPRKHRIQDVSDALFERAMLANNFEVKAVAEYLCVSRAAVYRRIEASSVYRLANDIPLEELNSALEVCDGDCDRAAARLLVSAASLRLRLRHVRAGVA